MENVKVAVTGQAKLGFRELNLKQGGNNVRWLNDREDRLLQTSLNSMEKAHKRTLNRLQHEVKGLHNTLREQATVRSPQIAKKAHHLTDKENSETKRPTMSLFTRTSDLKGESFSLSKTEERVEEFETVDHISLEDSKGLREKIEKGMETNSGQTKSAWMRKLSSTLKRPITKQLSSSSESSSSTTTLSVPRRKISVTDPPATRDLNVSHQLRKAVSQSSLQLSPNTATSRIQARSAEMINLSSTQLGMSPPLRKVSAESMPHVASPLFVRRKIPQNHPPRHSTSPRPVRKISCPPQIHHLPRVHQEEVIPLQPSRDGSGAPSRATATMATELPKLDVSRWSDPGPSIDANVSPLGFHVDGVEYNLQEKVNNFLRSLEKSDDIPGEKEKTSD